MIIHKRYILFLTNVTFNLGIDYQLYRYIEEYYEKDADITLCSKERKTQFEAVIGEEKQRNS